MSHNKSIQKRYRFRPRFRNLALVTVGIGFFYFAFALAYNTHPAFWGLGILGTSLGLAYLLAPTWNYSIEVSLTNIKVLNKGSDVVSLAWADITKMEYSETNDTAIVFGSQKNSDIVIPGKGLPAPYLIENKKTLLEHITKHIPPEKIARI